MKDFSLLYRTAPGLNLKVPRPLCYANSLTPLPPTLRHLAFFPRILLELCLFMRALLCPRLFIRLSSVLIPPTTASLSPSPPSFPALTPPLVDTFPASCADLAAVPLIRPLSLLALVPQFIYFRLYVLRPPFVLRKQPSLLESHEDRRSDRRVLAAFLPPSHRSLPLIWRLAHVPDLSQI